MVSLTETLEYLRLCMGGNLRAGSVEVEEFRVC
jgi:hypothetical protein